MIYGIGLETEFFNGQMVVRSKPDSILNRFAAETGGGYFDLKKDADLNSSFTRIAQELRSQYLLGFSPAALDGKVHRLEVRAKRPGLKTRSRRSYTASAEGTTPYGATCESFLTDVHHAFRGLRTSPAFTIAALTMLALGIGVNAAVFTVTKAALFAGFPLVERNDRLLYVTSSRGCCVSYPDFEDWRAHARSFEGMALVHGVQKILGDRNGFSESYSATEITADTFKLVGQKPILGRDFTPSDEMPGAAPVAILSHTLLGTALRKGSSNPRPGGTHQRHSYRCNWHHARWVFLPAEARSVGAPVANAGYSKTRRPRYLVRGRARGRWSDDRGCQGRVGDNRKASRARLSRDQSGVSFLRCAISASSSYLKTRTSSTRPCGAPLDSFVDYLRKPGQPPPGSRDGEVSRDFGPHRTWCGPVEDHSAAAHREPDAVERGSDLRLVDCQMERLGLCARRAWSRPVVLEDPRLHDGLPRAGLSRRDFDRNGVPVRFGACARLSKLDINSALKEGGRGAVGGARGRHLSAVLVIAEVALAVVLLAGAGVMTRSFLNIYNADLGIKTENVLTVAIELPVAKYPRQEALDFVFRSRESPPGSDPRC